MAGQSEVPRERAAKKTGNDQRPDGIRIGASQSIEERRCPKEWPEARKTCVPHGLGRFGEIRERTSFSQAAIDNPRRISAGGMAFELILNFRVPHSSRTL